MSSLQAMLARVVDLLRGKQSVRLPLRDFAALALAVRMGESIGVDEIEGALSQIGLHVGPLGKIPPSEFAEQGRLRVLHGRLHRVSSLGYSELLQPLIERLSTREQVRLPLGSRTAPSTSPRPGPEAPRGGAARAPKAVAPRTPPSSKCPEARAQRPAPPPPAKAPEPLAPTPPTLVPAPIVREVFDLDAMAALLSREALAPSAFALSLDAHLLGVADRFEELIALGRMNGVEPHGYQIETVRRVLRHFRGRTLLADEVGLGKTVEAMMILREYQLRGMVRRALVLVPPTLVGQWAGELSSKAGIEPHIAVDADESFWQREGVLLASTALARMPRHAPFVQAVGWDLVIVDEAHHLKNRTTQAFKLVDALRSRFLLLLTATPVENDLIEIYNLVTLLKPGQLSTLADFKRRFAVPKDPTGARDVPRLRGLLNDVMVRNTRANSGLSLPPRYVTTVVTEPTPPEAALYAQVLELFRAHRDTPGVRRLADTLLLEAGSSTAAVRASLERLASPAPALEEGLSRLRASASRVSSSAKAKALLDILRAHKEKVIVFTRFRASLGEVERLAREANVAAAVVHGGMARAQKEAALERFRGEAPLLLSTDVGSEGQNLQSCHVLVNYDLPWNPMVIEQRIGRIHRYGQTDPVRVYNLCSRGTAEERLLDVLDRRVHLFELVVGEMDMVLGKLVDEKDLEERVRAVRGARRRRDRPSRWRAPDGRFSRRFGFAPKGELFAAPARFEDGCEMGGADGLVPRGAGD